jgi:ABC-type proline/glycine betaine transport system ATPase subunit
MESKKDEYFIPGIKIQTAMQNSAAVRVQYNPATEFVSELVGNKWLKFQSLLNKEATGEKKSNTVVKVLNILCNAFVRKQYSSFGQRVGIGSSLFWHVTQRIFLAICRRFGTTHRSHL